MRNLLGRHHDRILLVVLLVAGGALLRIDHDGRQTFARRLGTSLYAPVQHLVQRARENFVLRQENRKLRRVVATLNLERMRLLQLRDEVDELRRVAGFARERFPYLLPCQIVGRSTDPYQNMLQLQCGAGDSLGIDQTVTAYAGLVGRVREVRGERALVETLASPDLAVSTRDQRSGVVGILRWVRGNQFRLERVDAVEDVLVGDPLVTSGLGGVYPAGIPVGVVTRVAVSLDGLFKEIEVRPHVDFAGLTDVFVVRRQVVWQDEALYRPEERATLDAASTALRLRGTHTEGDRP